MYCTLYRETCDNHPDHTKGFGVFFSCAISIVHKIDFSNVIRKCDILPSPAPTMSLTSSSYTGTEGTNPFFDVCVTVDTPGIFVANSSITMGAIAGSAG